MSPVIDWLLIGRYALLVSLTALIPVPLLDRWVENYLRRRLVAALVGRHGHVLSPEDLRTLGDAPSDGCMGCLWSVVMWPIKKVLRTVLVFWQAKVMADVASEVLHRALMLEEALEMGWVPGDAVKVRQAMDRTLDSVDTRVFERQLAGVYLDHTHEWNGWVHQRTGQARQRVVRHAEALADAAEHEGLDAEADAMSRAMASALRGTGAVPEALQWFRAEMGADRDEAPALAGVLEPEVLPAEEGENAGRIEAEPGVTDAEEVEPAGEGDRPEEAPPSERRAEGEGEAPARGEKPVSADVGAGSGEERS